ncbi:MAG: beta-ketoacyl synthase [Caldilineaceae bacterium]|nr:beta-ketoacyl synthase [Caldilineaceae bacterium]
MRFEPIAIVGQSCVLPGALDPADLWDLVMQGRSMVAPAPDDAWRIDKARVLSAPGAYTQDRAWSDHGGYVRDFAERFDPTGFLLPADEILALDPLFQWTLYGVREALRSAGLPAPFATANARAGLVLGNLSYPTAGLVQFAEATWFAAQEAGVPRPPGMTAPDSRNRFSSGLPAHLAAQALNLGGDAFALDAACASSLYAIKLACDRLHDGRADVMVAGAVNRTDDLFIHIGFCALQAMSRRGESRPFAADADGLVPGEGAAFVVLKRLDDAVAAGDAILGVIRGIGLSNDGNAGGFLSPSAAGQVRALEAAYAAAGLAPADISLLECHATGTAVGDATEIESAGQLFHGQAGVPIGSLKANLGHLITAAGAAGLIKVLGALRTGIRPPSRPVETPLAALAGSPFRLLQAPEPWEQQGDAPRRAAISAFGFGGNNAHLIVEEWRSEQWSTVNGQLPIVNEGQGDLAAGSLAISNLQSTINNSPIAIVAIEATVGPYPTFDAFAQALIEGQSGTTTDTFDINLAGLRFPPNDLKHTLPQQLLILEVARRLAAAHPELPVERTSVYIGMGCDAEIARYSMRWRLDEWASQWDAAGEPVSAEWIAEARAALIPGLEAAGVIGTMPNIPTNRINAQLNYLGPSHTVSAEELSGLRALEIAVDALRRGEIDAALVGAVDLSVEAVHQAAAGALLNVDRQKAGDAAVVLLLKRAADAHDDDVLATLTIDNSPLTIDHLPSLPALAASFGHAHAASGLLHIAAAVACLRERVRLSVDADGLLLPAEPWLADGERVVSVKIDALGEQSSAMVLEGDRRRHQKPSFLKKLGFSEGALHVFSGADVAGLLDALDRGVESNAGPARLVIVTQGDTTFEQQRATARAALSHIAPRPSPLAPPTPRPSLLAKGIYWSPAPMPGEVGFVFTPAAAAYQGMGRELLLALPDLADDVVGKFPCLTRTQDWLSTAPRPVTGDPFQILQGCALLSMTHALLTQEWLGIKPDAMLGVSSGETNTMFASGAWHDMDAMFAEIDASGMYTREIAGEYQAARRAWQDRDAGEIVWSGWRVLAPVAEVQAALAGEEFAYLTMINAPADCLVAGQADACRRVVDKIGRQRCVENANEIIAHHPAVKSWEAEWRAIHHRETRPVHSVRFYSNARGGAYVPNRESVADALTDQATAGVDFRRIVEAAWADGVRIFVEHGPRNVCSGWIRSILGEREHLVVALDRPQHGVEQLVDAVAQLVAAGVAVDYAALNAALALPKEVTSQERASRRVLSFPAHYPPVVLPVPAQAAESVSPRELSDMQSTYQRMEAPPPLPPVLAPASNGAPQQPQNAPQPVAEIVRPAAGTPAQPAATVPAPAAIAPPAAPVQAAPTTSAPHVYAAAPQPTQAPTQATAPDPMVEHLTTFHSTVSAAHRQFLAQQARVMEQIAALYQSAPSAPVAAPPAAPPAQPMPPTPPLTQSAPPVPPAAPAPKTEPVRPTPPAAAPVPAAPPKTEQPAIAPSPVKPAPRPQAGAPSPLAARPSPLPVRQHRTRYPGPALDRKQLEHVASGKISEVLGPIFAQQDDYVRQVRMPMPPLLLADRVLGIDAEAGAVGQKGTIWTETDIGPDAWYLHNGRMPVGVLIESGQADLLLVSYLGADFVNKSERVYRLLGCEVTFRAELPQVGETLHYEIHLDGYAQHGPVRIFFFHYDCFSGDRLLFSVREGQAGFFTDDELANSNGVIWDARTAEIVSEPRLDPPAVRCERRSFTAEQVIAFAEGRVVECFGEAFRAAENHVRTPTIARGRMLFFNDVVTFDPAGGPWQRGYLRADDHLTPDKWFFHGHFKNDPCMPGTMMYEGCLQTMAFYMAGLGYTLDRDGWRFEPVQDEMYKLVCRGQVIPTNKHVVYEVFVEEVIHGPTPTLYADLLVTVDGLAAFHCRRMGLRLVPAFPLESRQSLLDGAELVDPAPERNARTPDHVYDPRSIAACAWGAPSDAFGDLFARFDGPERCPRLPGPPYLFMTRITAIDAPKGIPTSGGTLEAEYQIPPDAWYFSENGNRTMPYAVLLEAALQPCGWFASYKGSVLQSDEELYFRNLDGTATQHREVFPEDGLLRTSVRNTSLSRLGAMTIVGFEVECFVGDELVFDMTTTFGFFPAAALASQAGLPVTDALRERLAAPSDFRRELRPRPPRYFNAQPALPGPMLLLLDRISGYWPDGGEQGLGRVRAEIDVNPQDWFFKCHFMGDSVQPGSLGLEAMIQTLQFFMLEEGRGARGEFVRPRFEPIQIGEAMTWKYRGQVLPSATRVTVDLEIVEKGDDYAVANASLWVDGLRIYEASRLGMRILEDLAREPQRREGAKVHEAILGAPSSLGDFVAGWRRAGDEVLDPAVDGWLQDHCPTWTVPALAMMSMVDRLAAGAQVRAPGRKVVRLRNVRVHRWLSFAGGAQQLKTLGRPVGADTVAMQLLVWEEDRARYALVASGDVILTEHWQLADRPWSPPADAQPEADPYAAGVLFHGPAYQLLTDLQMGSGGASSWLDLDASGVPVGSLNQGLLDAATHGIPHDALWRWSAEIPADVAAYPVAIPAATFHGPTPTTGRVRGEARFAGFQGDDRRFPMIRVQIITGDEVWAEFDLVETLFPKGPLGQADPAARRAFLADRHYVPGMALSSQEAGMTKLDVATVTASDWLAGTVATIYAPEAADSALDPAELARLVAIKEHMARRWEIHPSWVRGEGRGARGEDADVVAVSSPMLPLNQAQVIVRREGDTWLVRDDGEESAPAGLDLSAVQRFWRDRANAGGTAVEDMTLALMQRFIRRVEIADPDAFAALHGRGVLYLANHQLDLESVLFVSLIAAVQGTVTTAIARQELGESWVGPYFDICFQHPHIVDPHMLLLIDRGSPEAVFQALADALERTRTENNSLLVHVEGKHARRAGQPVEVISTALIDLAVSKDVPIVPLRFAGGLPVTPVDAPLAFPVDYGAQDFLVGAPILPETLAPLASSERRARVLDALNAVGGPWQDEVPNPGDASFAAAVAGWQQERGVTEVQAVLYRTLMAASDASAETRWLVNKVQDQDDETFVPSAEVKKWLDTVLDRLFGMR